VPGLQDARWVSGASQVASCRPGTLSALDPFFVIWTFMKRESHSGQIIGRNERIDAYTALQELTTGPAWQFFEEDRKGMVKAGLLADFVILSADPVKTGVDEMRDIEVLETIKEDRKVFRADQSAPLASKPPKGRYRAEISLDRR